MLRPVDLNSICSNILENEDLIERYKEYLGINFRKEEIVCIRNLISLLPNKNNLSNFYIGYKIPQINKEFDLLMFNHNEILNIELKSGHKDIDAIEKQLKINRYYLEAFGDFNAIKQYTYVDDSKKIYCFDGSEIKETNFEDLSKTISSSKSCRVDLDKICNPSEFLISPFNNTDNFLKDKYFLTQAQQEIKNKIEDESKGKYLITGKAGTGKTLLVYDIAKDFMKNGKKVKIIHCGNLNDGQDKLNENGWDIDPIKRFHKLDFENYDVVIIDEVQRMKNFSTDIQIFKEYTGKLLFSGDKEQWLIEIEKRNGVIEGLLNDPSVETFKLTTKIRSNKEIASFIKKLFDLETNVAPFKSDNIYLKFFDNESEGIDCSNKLSMSGWEVINVTPSQFSNEYTKRFRNTRFNTSHKVIGQEFDNVAVIIGENYYYRSSKLVGGGTYYDSTKMLFENLTRSKKRICLIIVRNYEVLSACLSILS